MRTRGPRLGDLLEHQGVLSREHLLRALRNQKVVGGKLGTCLLEIDAVSEDALLRALAEQQGVEPATPEDLRGIADEVLELVPAKVARGHLVVPFRSSGTQIQLAMIDARDLRALDELGFVTGRRVRPHVASEVRILEALEKYYGSECPPRFGKLLDRLNRSRFLWRNREEAPAREELQWDSSLGVRPTGTADGSPPTDLNPEAAPAPAQQANLDEPPLPAPATQRLDSAPRPHEFARTEAAPAPYRPLPSAAGPTAPALTSAPSTPLGASAAVASRPPTEEPAPATAPAAAPDPTPSTTLAGAAPVPTMAARDPEHRLQHPADADDVGGALVEIAATRSRLAALFQIRKSEVAGWFGHAVDPIRLGAFRLKLDRPSLFVALREGAAFHRGPLPELPAHSGLRVLLGADAATEVLVLPLRVRNRLIGALLVVPTDQLPDHDPLAELERVVAKASSALELCIMRRKLENA